MNKNPQDNFSDEALSRLLNQVSGPASSTEGMDFLLRRIAVAPAAPATSVSGRASFHWLTMVPLAASLAFGIYMGAAGVSTGLVIASDDIAAWDDDYTTGTEDVELLAGDEQS